MKRSLVVIIGLTLLTSCNEKIAKFIFDSSKVSNLTRYSYSYNAGKLTSSKETNYTVMLGQVADTIVTLVNCEYDTKGLLRKKLSKTALEDNPSLKLFEYNSNDSLIREMTISPEKDTTFWSENNYFPDGKKLVFRRALIRHHDPNQDFLKQMENKKKDTILYRFDYHYENNLCKSLKEYDKKNKLNHIIEYEYENGKVKKATYISLLNTIEVTEKMQYFDYSKSDLHPDYYSLDSNKDTIEYCKNEFIKHLISKRTDVFNYGKMINRTYFENGKRIGFISVDKTMNFRIVESYSYNEKGDLKEMKSYHEEIKKAI